MADKPAGISDAAVSQSVDKAAVAIVITDPALDDNPIVYVNDGFQKTTLYSREYALGRNCRFLQGGDTAEQDIAAVRDCIAQEKEFTARILNYKADGTPFLNELTVAPVTDDGGEITALFGVLREVTEEDTDKESAPDCRHTTPSQVMLKEMQHRVKNHLAMVVSLIRVQSRRPVTQESFVALSHRIEALALLYHELLRPSSNQNDKNTIAGGAYLSRIANVLAGINGRPSIRLNLYCEELDIPLDPAARMGLLLTELLTNTFEHAFCGRERGCVTVKLVSLGKDTIRLVVEDDGIGLPKGSEWPYNARSVTSYRKEAETTEGELDTTGHNNHSGLGGSIVANLTRMLNADLDIESDENGTKVTVEISDLQCSPVES